MIETNFALGKQQLPVALGNSAVLLLVTDVAERGGGGRGWRGVLSRHISYHTASARHLNYLGWSMLCRA